MRERDAADHRLAGVRVARLPQFFRDLPQQQVCLDPGDNDAFAFFVNGTNCALVPGTSTPVSIDNVNNGTNATYYRNNVPPDDVTPAPIDTQMDGWTMVLNCHATVNSGVTNHIKLAIAEAGESIGITLTRERR